MKHQPAVRKALLKSALQGFGLVACPAMTDGVVGIPLEWNGRPCPSHPHVEPVVQEQVGEDRTDHAGLRRPRVARLDDAVFPLHRRLQPALHVEQHPRAGRYVARTARKSSAWSMLSKNALMSMSSTQSYRQHRWRAVRTASIAERPGR